jgi:hypothetical protein
VRAGIVGLLTAASMGFGSAAHADVPPSDKIYSRTQTWTCPGLGVFTALYSPWGQNPHVKWLSVDGGRQDAVQVTIVWGDVTLTLGGETFHFVGPDNPPVRQGQGHYTCSIYGVSEDGRDSITGTAIVGVVPR